VRSFIIFTYSRISLSISNQGDEVGGAGGTHGIGEENIKYAGGKARREEFTRKSEVQVGGLNQNGS
jgi:hypothetical protein